MPYYRHLQHCAVSKGKHVYFYNEEGEAELSMCPVTKALERIEGALRVDGLANVCEGCGALLDDL